MADAIEKVRYTHDAMIDKIIENPWIAQGELAAHFGYTPGWVSQVMSSDVFKARLQARKSELIDPGIIQAVEERFEAIVRESQRVVMEKLGANPTGEFALKTLDVAARALGMGQKGVQQIGQQQNNYVVMLPPKAASAEEWIAAHAPPGEGSENQGSTSIGVTIEGEAS